MLLLLMSKSWFWTSFVRVIQLTETNQPVQFQSKLEKLVCPKRKLNQSINQSINQSWIYTAHKRKASNAL